MRAAKVIMPSSRINAEPAKIGAHVGKKPKRESIERISAGSSRLLDAVARTIEERVGRAVISYTQAMGDNKNV